jgi:hypothetical protein
VTDLLTVAAEPEAPAPENKVTSADIKIGLRTSLAKGYQVFFEVGNDTGTKVTRHADAVAIGIWPSTGHQIHGYEIKVSRGDFLSEMKDPQKSWPVMRYCHRWSLLTPPGLVKVDELPPNWGLSTFDGRSMRAVKHAPLLTPEALSPGFVAALVRRAGEVDAEIIGAARLQERQEVEGRYKAQFERKAFEVGTMRREEAENAIKLVAAFKEALGENWLSVHDVPEIAAAIKAIRKMEITGDGWRSIQHVCAELLEAEKRIRAVLSEAGLPELRSKRR